MRFYFPIYKVEPFIDYCVAPTFLYHLSRSYKYASISKWTSISAFFEVLESGKVSGSQIWGTRNCKFCKRIDVFEARCIGRCCSSRAFYPSFSYPNFVERYVQHLQLFFATVNRLRISYNICGIRVVSSPKSSLICKLMPIV